MQTIVILQIMGIVMSLTGFAMTLNPRQISTDIDDLFNETHAFFLMGLISLIIGAVILAFHHTWNTGWEIFITIVGGLALIKGFLYMAFPGFIMQLKAYYLSSAQYFEWYGALLFLVGIFLFWKSLTLEFLM